MAWWSAIPKNLFPELGHCRDALARAQSTLSLRDAQLEAALRRETRLADELGALSAGALRSFVAASRPADDLPETEEIGPFSVNEATCVGCGACAALTPEAFAMEGRVARVHSREVSRERLNDAMEACPVGAIRED